MEAPQCNNKKYENFTAEKKFCKANKVHSVFSSVALKDWCNFDLIIPNIVAASSSASFKKYSESLDTISQKLIRHPYVQDYAFRVKKYLKNSRVQAMYSQTFEDEQQKVERQRSKKRLNHTNELLSHAELTLESTESLSEVNKRIRLVKESIGAVHDEAAVTDEAAVHDEAAVTDEEAIDGEEATDGEEAIDSEETILNEGNVFTKGNRNTSVVNVSNQRKNVQSTIFDAGRELHHQYKAGTKLNFAQLKTMKCGLSNILDLSEQSMQFSQRSLFPPETWTKLVKKYNCLNLPLPDSIKTFKDKWETMSDLCIISKDSLLGKKYISKLESSPAITSYQLRILDLFREVIYLVDSRRFMLSQDNRAKISERDFTYQLWLPIFQKIFHINNEIIRIKVGETVLSESTESKASVYSSASNIVGFKVDMRFLLDFETEEFDLACAEACIPIVPEAKIHHDMSKLLREGKLMQTAALNVTQNSSVYSWVIQISGPSCSFHTVHSTKHQYHVCVHQFTVVFPREYSELPLFLKSLSNLFIFRDSLEAMANRMKATILKTRNDIDEGDLGASGPSTPTVFESASIYHTPPRRDTSNSRMPEYVYFNEFAESESSSSQGSIFDLHDVETDALGFVQIGKKWTNVLTGKTYSYNPYGL